MDRSEKKPGMRPCELKDGSGWYVLVTWGSLPPEQVGGFATESEAQEWIEHSSASWLEMRLVGRSIG